MPSHGLLERLKPAMATLGSPSFSSQRPLSTPCSTIDKCVYLLFKAGSSKAAFSMCPSWPKCVAELLKMECPRLSLIPALWAACVDVPLGKQLLLQQLRMGGMSVWTGVLMVLYPSAVSTLHDTAPKIQLSVMVLWK